MKVFNAKNIATVVRAGAGAVATAGFLGSAMAGPALFNLTTGYGTTDNFDNLASNVQATSVYTSPIGPVANFGALLGLTNIGLQDNATGGSVNSLNLGVTGLSPTATNQLNGNYKLEFSYSLSGTASLLDGGGNPLLANGQLDATGANFAAASFGVPGACGGVNTGFPFFGCGGDVLLPNFTSGTITLTYKDLVGTVLGVNMTQQIAEFDLASFVVDGANVNLLANVDYAWYDPMAVSATRQALVEDFFNFQNPVDGLTSWYDLWASGTALDPVVIKTSSNFNVFPNKIPTCVGSAPCDDLSRSTLLNITTTAEMAIPEPGSLALVGVALIGLVAARRRFSAA